MLKALKQLRVVIPFLLIFSVDGFAAVWPQSLQLQAYAYTHDGNKLAMYSVKCSDGSQPVIVKTVGERDWAVAGESGDFSYRDKIKAAQSACNIGVGLEQRLADAQ